MSEHDSNSVNIAVLQTKMSTVETEIHEIRTDIKSILSTVNQTRGGWKVIIAVAGVAGATGAFAAKLIPFLGGVPK